MDINTVGVGDKNASFRIYMENTPQFEFANASAQSIKPIQEGEIYACSQQCGNGWRKVFNVYAKLVFAYAAPHLLKPELMKNAKSVSSWQEYRDYILLQEHSNTALIFDAFSNASANCSEACTHIVMGRTYAKTLALTHHLTWLNQDFAIDYEQKLIVCPYFDYRQLSNVKIIFLVDLLHNLHKHTAS